MEKERTSPVKSLPIFTYDDLMGWEPCWAKDEIGRRQLLYYKRKLGGQSDGAGHTEAEPYPGRGQALGGAARRMLAVIHTA